MDNVYAGITDIAQGRLDPMLALDFVADPRFGGVAIFIGRVREHNLGRSVTGVSYDLFKPLALKTFADIAVTIRNDIDDPLKLYIAHACGRLGIGDVAVVVAAGTPHRDEAFRACRAAIEAVKHESPIWKQEHYTDGDSAWSEGCSLCEEHRDAERASANADHSQHVDHG